MLDLWGAENQTCQGTACPPGYYGRWGSKSGSPSSCIKCPDGMFSRAEISYDMHPSALELGCERCPLGDWQRSPAGSASKEQCTCDPSKLVQPCANCSSGCRCFDNHRITTGAIVEKGKRVGTWKSCEKCVEGEECPPISCVEGGTKGRVNSSVFVASCWLLLTLAFQEQWTYETY